MQPRPQRRHMPPATRASLEFDKIIEDVADDDIAGAMRVVEDTGRAEDDGETDRHQGVERADLDAVDEELPEQHVGWRALSI